MEDPKNHLISNTSSKTLINQHWSLCQTTPGQYQSPTEFNFCEQDLFQANVPSTVATAINTKKPDCWTPTINYDDYDWWYQTTLNCEEETNQQLLVLEGLATLADVWLNDQLVLSSNNMFHCHQIDLENLLKKGINHLTLHFKSLSEVLNQRHPRPRWKTKLVNQQTLRWFRTTLLGRIPGWTPPVSAVGPWKPIYLVNKSEPINIHLKTAVEQENGVIDFSCDLTNQKLPSQACLKIDNVDYPLSIQNNQDNIRLTGRVKLPNIRLWWPHTHGKPYLYQAKLSITLDGLEKTYSLNKVGFKSVELINNGDDFKININQQAIFCRGACWTINDIVSLSGNPEVLKQNLTLMRDAGANMIRIGGTMVYEQELFYQLCDELGIMVWQDFMFANMDYPFEDNAFYQSVEIEIKQQITRLSQHACLTTYCGNSEIQQQVAMLGFDKTTWEISFFEKTLPELCHSIHPNIPYISSSPWGGQLPFISHQNLSHYYGVGAYLKPTSELRKDNVKFTSECLGFSNVPATKTRNSVLNGDLPMTHNPIWKQRTPRDSGTGWDFEDVRDHYLKQLFNLNPVHLRSFDPDRYINLSEIVTGEIMSQTYQEWRSQYSQCQGGLIWFMKDLWPGAGWGIIDSESQPKACYYYLKRTWQPISVAVTDESINGLHLHLNNETPNSFSGTVVLDLINQDNAVIAHADKSIHLEPNSQQTFNAEDLLGHFYDITYSYRFGPAKHHIVSAKLIDSDQSLVNESVYFPMQETFKMVDSSVQIDIEQLNDDTYQITIISSKFLHAVNLETPGYLAEDNFFHLIPNLERRILLHKNTGHTKTLKGYLSALNLNETIKLKA